MRGKREYSFLLSSPIRFSLIPFVVVEVVCNSNKGFVGENEYEFPITRSRWKREKFEKFRRYAREKLSTLSLSSVLRSSSHDSRKWRSVGGNLPTWPESFLFFFPLLSSPLIREFVARRSWGRPPSFCAEFRLEMLNWRTKKTRETKKRDILQRERERETLEDRTSSRMIPVCELAERKLTMRRYVIATFNRNHHSKNGKKKRIREKKKREKKCIKFHSAGGSWLGRIGMTKLRSLFDLLASESSLNQSIPIDVNFVQVCTRPCKN